MKVTLLNYTRDAESLLIFTKNTRLNMTPELMSSIERLDDKQRAYELGYMANTIPSSWEFVDYTFLVEGVSRAYTHQQVRTRAASYAQQSMRITNMADFAYVYSDRMAEHPAKLIVDEALDKIKSCYKSLIDIGVPAEDARGILPTNIATNIVCKFNLRTFSELANSRTGGRTQEEYRRVVNAMVDEVLAVHPWAEKFIFKHERDYFAELEEFAAKKFPDLRERGELLKIIDHMRKEKQ